MEDHGLLDVQLFLAIDLFHVLHLFEDRLELLFPRMPVTINLLAGVLLVVSFIIVAVHEECPVLDLDFLTIFGEVGRVTSHARLFIL